MTDRVHSLAVVLDQDYREDDEAIERLKTAIRQFHMVAEVVDMEYVDGHDYMARIRMTTEIREKVYVAMSKIFYDLDPEEA